jgi:lysophospholipase L1-like esterase
MQKLFLVLICLWLAPTLPGTAASDVYTPPDIPPGVDRTTVPAAREDWRRHVQENFIKARGKHFDVVFDGDSITAGWNWKGRGQEVWDSHFAKLNAIDFGIAGDQVQNVLWRLQQGQLDGIDPKLVVLMIGANNLTIGNDTPSDTVEGIKALLSEYLKVAPNAKFLLMGVLPQKSDSVTDVLRVKVSQVNAMLPPLADGKRVFYHDFGSLFLNDDGSLRADFFVSDRVHPAGPGYQAWADALQPEMDKLLPSTP